LSAGMSSGLRLDTRSPSMTLLVDPLRAGISQIRLQ
jgi:hypothetical protein